MAIEGALQDVSLADICQLLGMGRKTGCLSITDRSNFGYIYFQKGRVIHASVLNRRDRLGELLVRNQVITREDLSSAIERQGHGKGMRLGQILVEMGAIEREELRRYIQMQVEEAVYHLFAWQTGAFHFDTDQMPDEDGLLLVDISPEALLMEGARRVDEWSLIEKKVPSFDIVFQVDVDPSTSEGEVELTREQRKILPFIDGVRTAHEIMNEAGLVEFETGKALYGLIQAGFVSRAGERSTDAETGGDETLQHRLNVAIAFYRSGMLDDAQREFEDLLSADPHQARANFMMGLIAFRKGRLEEAVAHFRSMPSGYAHSYAVHRNTALALEALGRYEEALEELRAAGAARPKDHEIHLARGVVHFKAGQIEQALEAFRRYRTYPGLKVPSELYYTYAVLAVGMAGSLDAAIAIGQEGMGRHPKSGAILVNVGNILDRRGDADAAVALYERAAALTPPLPQAHKSLGDHAYARGDLEVARVHYEKAVKLAPRLGDDVYLRLGSMAHEANDRDVALLLWRRALELNPRNETARSHLELLQAE